MHADITCGEEDEDNKLGLVSQEDSGRGHHIFFQPATALGKVNAEMR